MSKKRAGRSVRQDKESGAVREVNPNIIILML